MKATFSILLAVLSIFVGSCFGPAVEAAESYLVPKQGFECFRQNIEAYAAASRDPVVIYFPVCPKVEFTAQDLQSGTVDSLPKPGPSLPGAKTIITLTKTEIACIAAGKATISAAATDIIMVNLRACH